MKTNTENTESQRPLSGRSAVITGANQGLGRAMAESFVRAGASVFLLARSEDLLKKTEQDMRSLVCVPNQVVASMPADVSRPEVCAAAVERARTMMPGITILVNNAGIYGPMGRIEDNDWDEWIQTIQINLFGAILMTRQVLPLMRQQRYGKIINLSGGGATAPLPHMSAYATSKAALVRFTETLAEEVRDVSIDVNAIAPGALNTRLLDQVLAAGPEKVGKAFYERSIKQRDEGGVPLSRGADLAVFLASAASDGVSGRLLSAVWDNWAALPEKREVLARSDVFTLRRITPEDRSDLWKCA